MNKERVTHILDPTSSSGGDVPLYLPRVSVGGKDDGSGGTDGAVVRPLGRDDASRVLDYPGMPDPPADCDVMHCQSASGDPDEGEVYDGNLVFPKRTAVLRAGYLFLLRPGTGPDGAVRKDGTSCIPLRGCSVEFPPGGRRVFREHAHTGARRGYEMAIKLRPDVGGGDGAVQHVVLLTLGQREAWSAAIRLRCDVGDKPTVLRPGGLAGSRLASADQDAAAAGGRRAGLGSGLSGPSGAGGGGRRLPGSKSQRGLGGARSSLVRKEREPTGDADLDAAIERFGIHGFSEEGWVHDYLRTHPARDLAGECERLDRWTDAIKRGLRGAVLEQYEYFVEASREMSTMGREVGYIRSLVEGQQEALMVMKNIDFGAGFEVDGDEYGDDGPLGDGLDYLDDAMDLDGDDDDDASASSSSSEEGPAMVGRTPMRANSRARRRESGAARRRSAGTAGAARDAAGEDPRDGGGNGMRHSSSAHVEIPDWIQDVNEEVSAMVKESRYSDATELVLRARKEISDILATHEPAAPPVVTTPTSVGGAGSPRRRPSAGGSFAPSPPGSQQPRRLGRRQHAMLTRTASQVEGLMDRMSRRLSENLSRKNAALRASAKRERADPLSNLAPLVSPVCLSDDAVALHLLVRLGRYREAATAYAARRSLLLSECLHERPISSPVGMDAVIYAAQISSSFFSSLAGSVEGFLDLFVDGGGGDDDASLNSRSMTIGEGGRRIPSGALSAIVLWCDSELVKFTNVFGSSRLLGGLSLSPPGVRRTSTKEVKVSLAKEREHSIEVAAKCCNQAFSFATENLDTIGLPLTPKLAENIRPKLKGCEAEVAELLDVRWRALAFDWTLDSTPDRLAASRLGSSSSSAPRSLANDRGV